jgi:hypothetical protein
MLGWFPTWSVAWDPLKVWRNASLWLSEVSDQPNDQAEENKGVSASGDDTQRRG